MIQIAAILTALLLSVTGAHAQATTSYVSANGNDSQTNCLDTAAPCKTLVTALSKTAVGGSIVCLTPVNGGNAITISKSVQINCPGTLLRDGTSGVSAASINISIPPNGADPYREVVLRGLQVEGITIAGTGRFVGYGVNIASATSVVIDGMAINGVAFAGIRDVRSGGQTRLHVSNSLITNSGGPGVLAAAGATGIVVLDNVKLLNNTFGLAAATGNNVVVTRSTISGNTTAGVEADPGASVNVSNSTLSHNNVNVQAFGRMRLQENNIQFSNTAVQGSGAVSLGANRFSGNGSLGSTPTLATGAPSDVFN